MKKKQGDIIKKIRFSLGLNQRDFAKLLNTSQSTVFRIENNLYLPITIARKLIKLSNKKYTLDDIYS